MQLDSEHKSSRDQPQQQESEQEPESQLRLADPLPEQEKENEEEDKYQPLCRGRRKSDTPGLMRMGLCHFCKAKHRLVYCCFRNYHPTGCEKKYCFDCLLLVFQQNIVAILAEHSSWKCPFARKACRCRGCAKQDWIELGGDLPTVVQLKETFGLPVQAEQGTRGVLRQRCRGLLELGGRLMSEMGKRGRSPVGEWVFGENAMYLQGQVREWVRKGEILED